MAGKIGRSFINAIVDVTPIIVCSLGASLLLCTVLGLSFGLSGFPTFSFYFVSGLAFAGLFIIIRVYREAKDKIDCYMQAAVSGTFIGLLNSEILREAGFAHGWLGDSYWEYKLVFFVSASFWHGLIMFFLFKALKKKKTASIRMQSQLENLN